MLKKIATLAACLATVTAGAAAYTAATTTQMGPGPTEYHARVMEDLGTWKGEGKMYMPGMPATSFTGMEVNTKLGEFWLVSKFTTEMMGMPFEGLATAGYDPQKEKFVGTWIDVMNPTMSVMEGTLEDGAIVYHYEQYNSMTGKSERVKSVNTRTQDGKRTFKSYTIGEDGSETLGMEIHYTKVSGAAEASYDRKSEHDGHDGHDGHEGHDH